MSRQKKSWNRKKISALEKYLTAEIGIEFKACLYFFCILFFYSMYRVIGGSFEASIIHMAEIIVMTYAMGYIQVYLLGNFDEGAHLRGKEIGYVLFCSLIYTGVSFLGKWFDRDPAVSIGFFFFMVLAYVCAFFVYKSKREIDEKILNEDLKAFQERYNNEECDRD